MSNIGSGNALNFVNGIESGVTVGYNGKEIREKTSASQFSQLEIYFN